LKEEKCSQKDEDIKNLEERLQRLEMNHDRSTNCSHGSHHAHRHSSRSSSNAHDNKKEHGRRRHHHEDGHQNVAKPYFPIVKLPSFSGDSDPNVYLGWEPKCEQIFHVHAMPWWHKTLMDIGLNKRPPVVSWDNLKKCMRDRFVPPHFWKGLLLKLQRLHQGTLSVDAYFKELDTLLIKVNMHENEEAKMARFVSVLRRDIQDVVELHEYSSLQTLHHLAIKVETQISKKNAFKNTLNDSFYNNS